MKKFIINIFIILLTIGFSFGIAFYFLYLQTEENFQKLINYCPKQNTIIYDKNEQIIAEIYDVENREYIIYKDLNDNVLQTLLAIEDVSFFQHNGFDTMGILRAFYKNITNKNKKIEGGSTITQQLIKNTLLTNERTIVRKLKEIILALKIEKTLSKEKILEIYLNEIYFGNNCYGIQSAAYKYFGKKVKDLTLKESAMLTAIPKSPLQYDPIKNYQQNITRSNLILKRLLDINWINKQTYEQSIQETPILKEKIYINKYPYITDLVLSQIAKDTNNSIKDIKAMGLQIYTTIDSTYQDKIENIFNSYYYELIKKYKLNDKQFNGAIVISNPMTGEISAIISGISYEKSKFNRVSQASRPIGSTIKPFIYNFSLLSEDINEDTILDDTPKVVELEDGEIWEPKNYDNNYAGDITLRNALINSKNMATLDLIDKIDTFSLLSNMKDIGFKKIIDKPAIYLGAYEMTPYELHEVYTIFSNSGTKISNKVWSSFKFKDTNMKEKIVYNKTMIKKYYEEPQIKKFNRLLEEIVNSGTATNAKIKNIKVYGKTGTTNGSKDTWFCGFTNNTQITIWFGNDDNTPIYGDATGGKFAATLFPKLIKK